MTSTILRPPLGERSALPLPSGNGLPRTLPLPWHRCRSAHSQVIQCPMLVGLISKLHLAAPDPRRALCPSPNITLIRAQPTRASFINEDVRADGRHSGETELAAGSRDWMKQGHRRRRSIKNNAIRVDRNRTVWSWHFFPLFFQFKVTNYIN